MRGSETAANAACHAFQSVRDPEGRVGPVSLLLEGEKTGFSQHCVIDLQVSRCKDGRLVIPSTFRSLLTNAQKKTGVRRRAAAKKAPNAPACILLLLPRRRRRAHTRAPEMLRLSNAPSLHIAAARRRRPHHTHAPKRDATTTPLKRTPSPRRPPRATAGASWVLRSLIREASLGIGLGVVFGSVWSVMQTGPVARRISEYYKNNPTQS